MRHLRMENAALELRVRERTIELEAANQGLEAANKELEAFSYSVSHDLRTPLRHIDGFARILVDDYAAQLPEDAQRLLDKVCAGATRLGMLIDDLLNFSRLSRQPLVKRTVSLASLVQEVLHELERDREEPARGDSPGASLPNCHGDAALLKQVFTNLLSNAP